MTLTSAGCKTVRISLPRDLVVEAERSLLPLFKEAVPGFRMTRGVFVAMMFENGVCQVMMDRHVGKGEEGRLVPGPDREATMQMVREYVGSLFEERPGEVVA